MSRARSLVLALLSAVSPALAACEQSADDSCPGNTIATLELRGTLDAAGTGCVASPTGGWNPPATLPDGNPDHTYQAVFSWEPGAQQLAYCTGGLHSAILYGTRSGDHLSAQATLAGAVLGQCSATCAPRMTLQVEGDLVSTTSPRTFTGTLVETFHDGAGDCGACRLPCASRYTLTGTER